MSQHWTTWLRENGQHIWWKIIIIKNENAVKNKDKKIHRCFFFKSLLSKNRSWILALMLLTDLQICNNVGVSHSQSVVSQSCDIWQKFHSFMMYLGHSPKPLYNLASLEFSLLYCHIQCMILYIIIQTFIRPFSWLPSCPSPCRDSFSDSSPVLSSVSQYCLPMFYIRIYFQSFSSWLNHLQHSCLRWSSCTSWWSGWQLSGCTVAL